MKPSATRRHRDSSIGRQAVAGLDLERRDAGAPAPRAGEPRRQRAAARHLSPLGSRRPMCGCRRPRTARRPCARRTRRCGHRRRPGGCGCRRSRGSRSVPPASMRSVGGRAGRLDRHDSVAVDHHRRVAEQSQRALPQGRIVGDQQADVVDHGGGAHDAAAQAVPIDSASSAATSIDTWRPSTTTTSPADHHVTDVGGRRSEHCGGQRVRRGAAGGAHAGQVDGHQIGQATDDQPAGVGPSEAVVPVDGRRLRARW